MEEKSNDLQGINHEKLKNNIIEKESKDIYLINDEFLTLEILSFLKAPENNIKDKSLIIKYLIKCLVNIPININILLNKEINGKSLYNIIIYEYIINYEQTEYKEDLKNLFNEIMKNIGYDKFLYKYLISFIADYINKKSLLLNEEIKNKEIIPFNEKIKFNEFNSGHLLAILELIYLFYEEGIKLTEPNNYIYFLGEKNAHIIINNESNKLDTKNDIYIMIFFGLLDKKYFCDFSCFSLLEIKLNNKSSIYINVNEEIYGQKEENNNSINIHYNFFKFREINQILIKISKNNTIQIVINNIIEKIYKITLNNKDEIDSLIFFEGFIGICSNIIIYKNHLSNEVFIPKFFSDDLYKNGIYNEDLFSPFIKSQLSKNLDENFIRDKNLIKFKEKDISEFKNFYINNLISIYIPSRNEFSENSKSIILFDLINGLNATLSFNNKSKIGIYCLSSRTLNAFYDLGSINHLLPIMELITKEAKFRTKAIFNKYIDIIIYIFSKLSNYFKFFDRNAEFFFHFGYFLEKIDDVENHEIFTSEFYNQLKLLNEIFIANKKLKNYELFIKNYSDFIFMNEKIWIKFNFEIQKEMINHLKNAIVSENSIKNEFEIIKIINILFYYDSYKDNKYCCKEHSQYFNNAQTDESDILNPELNTLIEPIMDLIKKIFNLYIENFKNSNMISSKNNYTQKLNDYNLDKLIDILTFNVSPCLQKLILNLFFELRNKPKELNHLNKNGKIFSILLFLLKTTVFNDIRILLYDFIFVFINDNTLNINFGSNNKDKNNNSNIENIINFVENNILPFYLFVNEKEIYITSKNIEDSKEEKFKEYFFKDNTKYEYLTLSEGQKILNKNYKKEKLKELIETFFDKVYNNFYQGLNIKTNLNILIKLVSKGNALLSLNFLDKINIIFNSKDTDSTRIFNQLKNEIINNMNLFHWLLDTNFHIYLLKDQIKLNIQDEYSYGIIFPLNSLEEEKNTYITKLKEILDNLIIKIINNDFYKLDYVLTFGKYYYSLIEENNNFKIVRDFIFTLIFNELINNIKEIYNANIYNNKVQKMSLYFYNIIFEYYTFFKTTTSLNYEGQEALNNLYKEINSSFKLNILTELKDSINEDIYDILPKLDFYSFMKKVYLQFQSLWKDESTKIKNDKNFYKTYIYHKENIAIYELQLLFYSFDDIKEEKLDKTYSLANAGIPLIYILFHQFTIFLMTTDKNEFKEIIKNFRYFISLIIISSTTLCISKNKANSNLLERNKDKINWPNEDQYKLIQNNVKLFLFNIFYYLYKKISDINDKLNNSGDNKNRIENLKSIKKYLYDTLCYFLRILNTILKEKIKREEEKKKQNIKAMFKVLKKMIITKIAGIDLSGAYSFFYEFYTKGLIKNNSYINNSNKKQVDNLDLINSFILNNKSFLEDIPIYNIDDFLKEDQNYDKMYEKIEKAANDFMENENIKEYLNDNIFEYQKILFPFLKTIFNRKQSVNNFIPIYDNSIYCQNRDDKFNSICLFTNYFPIYIYDIINKNSIKKFNSIISDDIRLLEIKRYFEKYAQRRKYNKIKKRLFIFKGLWSKEEFYYDNKNYEIKYKLLNHLTGEFSKIFLTPIINIDYYLPKFSSFNTKELFKHNNKNNIISLEKIIDLNEEELVNKDKKINEKNELINNNIKAINELNYKFVEDLSFEFSEKNKEHHFRLLSIYLLKSNGIKMSEHCSIEQCCLVKTSFHVKGIFYNNYNELGFYGYSNLPSNDSDEDLDYDPERKACFGSIFKSQKEKYNGYYLKIPFKQIAFVLKRRYFFKTTALEIYTIKNNSYYFNFKEKDAKKVYDNIKYQMKSTIEDIQIEYSKNDNKIGFVNNNDSNNIFINSNMLMYKKKDMNLKNLYEKWQNWEISTFKFLMLCNIYSNRSLNDINQYPVFPWIITNYKDKIISLENNNLIRPFELPMGMMNITKESKARKQSFLELWKNLEEDDENDPNSDRYSVHYSTSMYTCYYLIRIFPFSNINIEIQGAGFDDPNRLFIDLENSFKNSITQKSDLRELIPEIFVFPEMFFNMNNLKLGKIEKSEEINNGENNNLVILINDVSLPLWSDNDGYKFIKKHRELLESSKINETINEWFNIIFGSKQKGKEAKKINNLFMEQTYDDYEEKYNKLTKEEKMNVNRMIEFGVTPNQIFKNDTNKRKIYSEVKNMKPLLYNTIVKNENNLIFEEIDCDFDNETPFRIFEFQKEGHNKCIIFILTKKNVKIYSRITQKIEQEENSENKQLSNSNKLKDNLIAALKIKDISKININKKDDILLPEYSYRLSSDKIYYEYSIIFGKGKYIALGGYYNGNIIIKNLDNKLKDKEGNKSIYIYSTNEDSPITKMLIDNSETYAIFANKKGTIFIFFISPEKKYEWMLSKVITHQKSEITALSICENLNIFISCSKEGYCMLYSLPKIKLFNSFKISLGDEEKNIFCSFILIYHVPLACFIFYIKNQNAFYIYSINGKFLQKNGIDYEIVPNGIEKYIDYEMRDYLLIYNSKDKTIDIHRAIDFQFVSKSPVINYEFIGFVLYKDLDHALILVKNNKKENEVNTQESKYKILVLKDKTNELIWK